MGKMVVIQSILLAIVTVALSMLFVGYFSYIFALILGFLTLFYLKKHSKKDVLKTNLWSSLVALILVIVVYIVLFSFVGAVLAGGSMGESLISIINVSKLLPSALAFIVLFNLPVLIYYFFGKKHEEAPVNPNA